MITKDREYIAEIFKIAGFAFVAPFGKLVLGIPYFSLEKITIESLLNVVLTFSFACIGIILIVTGSNILRAKEN